MFRHLPAPNRRSEHWGDDTIRGIDVKRGWDVGDSRTRRQKLEDMAGAWQSSPFESQNAITMIVQMDSKTNCPGCGHGDNFHVAWICYRCGDCGWSIRADGWHDPES